jgi:uncharacterized protein (DUF2249 family)
MITEDEYELISKLENCPGLWRVEISKEKLGAPSLSSKKALSDLFFKKK